MIQYLLDETHKYKEELLVHLRTHNEKYVADKSNESKYIYIYRKHSLVGFVNANFGWSWAGFGDLYYTDIDSLRTLVSETVKLFKNNVVGYKMYSKDLERIEDLKQSGFTSIGTVPGTQRTGDYTCLDLHDLNYNYKHNNEVKIVDEELEMHKGFITQYNDEYKKTHNLDVLEKEVLFVALEENEFCGAALSKIYQDYMHVHLLAVKQEHRGKGIATELMRLSEEYAIDHKLESIDLGTTGFQAKPFYENLGYKVVFVRDNYPHGYKCYTLYKKL